MDYKRIFKDGIHLLAGRVGTSVLALINLIILARILTTEEMGIYSLFMMIINLALIIGLNWSDSSIVRHGREEHILRDKVNKSFWARMYLFAPIVLLISLILTLFQNQITQYIGIEPKLIGLIIAIFILHGFLNFIKYIHQSIDQMKKSAYVLFSQKALFLLTLGLVFLINFETNITLVLIFVNLSFLLAVILNLLFFNYKKVLPYEFDKTYFKKIWKYSWPHLIGFSGIYILNYIDLYVINRYMTLHDVGVYSVAYNGFSTITGVLMIYFTVFFPLIVEYKTNNQTDKIKHYAKNIPRHTAIWIALVIIGLLLSRWIITLIFSNKYVESIAPFNILLIASIFYFLLIGLLPLVNAFDLILYSQIFNVLSGIINIVADFALVPIMGIMGAAYGTLITYAAGFVFTLLLVRYNKNKIFGGSNEIQT